MEPTLLKCRVGQRVTGLRKWPPQGSAGPFDTRREAFTSYPDSLILRRVDRIVWVLTSPNPYLQHEPL